MVAAPVRPRRERAVLFGDNRQLRPKKDLQFTAVWVARCVAHYRAQRACVCIYLEREVRAFREAQLRPGHVCPHSGGEDRGNENGKRRETGQISRHGFQLRGVP